MDTAAKVLMAYTFLNGAILTYELVYNLYNTMFPL